MTDTKYKPGERLRITFEGVVRDVPNPHPDSVHLVTPEGTYAYLEFPETGVTIERLAPAVVGGRVYRDAEGDTGLVVTDVDGHLRMHWVDGGSVRVDLLSGISLPLTQVWPPLDGEPPHAWPPVRAGLRYRDKDGSIWESVSVGDEIRVHNVGDADDLDPGRPMGLNVVAESWGPMTPLGGAS